MQKRALIFGITGQDGSYLTEYLLGLGYEVFGVIRRSSTFATERIDHLFSHPSPNLIYGDVTDGHSIYAALKASNPHEVYNLAAQSHVRVSFDHPVYTAETIAIGTANILACIWNFDKSIRFYQASSSEMYGSTPPPQNEETTFHPRSPYACAKAHAHYLTQNYRERGLHASAGILFNHESPRRTPTFVTRKITCGLASIRKNGGKLYLGNLEAQRDWGYAGDYVKAMHLMLQQEKPDDYVIGTGDMHTVQNFLEQAFCCFGMNWRDFVEIDERYMRPTEVNALQADYTKARMVLKWRPKTSFEALVKLMVEADCGPIE